MNANLVNTTAGNVRQLPTGKWQATLLLGTGRGARKTTKTFPTRRAATAWLQQAKRDGVPTGPASEQTVAQAFATYIAAKVLKPQTIGTFVHARNHAVAAKIGDTKLAALKPSAQHAYTAHLVRHGLDASTVNLYAKKLSAVLRFAAADGGLGFTPKAVTVPDHVVEVPAITAADVKALYEASPEEFAPAILLGAFAGLRASEAAAVTVADIDWHHGTLSVNKAINDRGEFVTTKTPRSMRTVPLAPGVVAQLAAFARGKPLTDTIATNTEGGVLPSSWFARTFSRVSATAGVPITFHALRKFYATTLLANGVNPKAAAKYLGDSIEVMLRTYALTQSTDAELAKAATASAFAATVAA